MSVDFERSVGRLPHPLLDKTVWQPANVAAWLEKTEARVDVHRLWLGQMRRKFTEFHDAVPLAMAGELFEPMANLLIAQWKMVVEGRVGRFAGWASADLQAVEQMVQVSETWQHDVDLARVSKWYKPWLVGLGLAARSNTSTKMRDAVERMRGASGRLYRAGLLVPLLVVSDYVTRPNPPLKGPLAMAEVEFYVGMPVARDKAELKYIDESVGQFEPTKKSKSRTNMIMEFVTGSGQVIFSLASGQAISRGMMLFVNALETIPGLEKMCGAMGMPIEKAAVIIERYIYVHEQGHGLYSMLKASLDECGGDVPAVAVTNRLYEQDNSLWSQAMLIVAGMMAWQADTEPSEAANDDSYRLAGQVILNILFGSGIVSMKKRDRVPGINLNKDKLDQMLIQFRDEYLRPNNEPSDYIDPAAKYFVAWCRQFKQ